MDKTDVIAAFLLGGAIIGAVLFTAVRSNDLAQEESKCRQLCTGQGMILSSSDYPQCDCAPDKAYYEDSEIRTFHINEIKWTQKP